MMKRAILFTLLVVALTGLSGLLTHATGHSSNKPLPPMHPATLSPVRTGEGLVPLMRIFVHQEDIYPNRLRVTAGTVRLRAENETLGNVSLALDVLVPGGSSQRVAVVQTVNTGKRADQQVTLSKGEYAYYDESRPDIRGQLIVDE
jgi:cupredoxin-like protein